MLQFNMYVRHFHFWLLFPSGYLTGSGRHLRYLTLFGTGLRPEFNFFDNPVPGASRYLSRNISLHFARRSRVSVVSSLNWIPASSSWLPLPTSFLFVLISVPPGSDFSKLHALPFFSEMSSSRTCSHPIVQQPLSQYMSLLPLQPKLISVMMRDTAVSHPGDRA